ncbi:MAG: hypothetical protein AAF383_27005 [Cyanobacteria bacterium P01_A01_bin.83]
MFHHNQSPALPCEDLLCQTKIKPLAQLPIGIKIKSFKIDADFSPALPQHNLKLPNFDDLHSYSLPQDSVYNLATLTRSAAFHKVATELVPLKSQGSFRAIGRFWWQWLLSSSQKISLLVFLILLQSSTQATNLLDKAKIYIDLNSHQAVTLPSSGKIYLKDSQASPLNRAIEQSRKIEVDSPFYPEAQADIYRWSETILDIAQGRANSGDYAGAIKAVELIPQNYPATELIAQEAAEAVAQWRQTLQQQQLNQDYLIQAKSLIEPNSASSYNRAIGTLEQITPDAKEYSEAQELINKWNEKIYLIVKNRAKSGNFKQAADAATLVNTNSIYHQLAKDEIEIRVKSIYAQYTD